MPPPPYGMYPYPPREYVEKMMKAHQEEMEKQQEHGEKTTGDLVNDVLKEAEEDDKKSLTQASG